jgi:polyhydroxyalkanoate synthesis regulator phasin
MVEIKKRRDELLKQGKITQEQAKDAFHIEELMYEDIDFPKRGKALMDAIKLIHQYLQMVDDNTVVILHIG